LYNSEATKPIKKQRGAKMEYKTKNKISSITLGNANTTNLLANPLTHAQMMELPSQMLPLEKNKSVVDEREVCGTKGGVGVQLKLFKKVRLCFI